MNKAYPIGIVELPEQSGVGPYAEPTLPTELWPQTPEARLRGCACPAEENEKRLRAGLRPKLVRSCRVHSKICQAEQCEHGDHTNLHTRCEHCTNVLHVCIRCEKVYIEDGDDPSLAGWMFVENDSIGRVRGWYCRTCR